MRPLPLSRFVALAHRSLAFAMGFIGVALGLTLPQAPKARMVSFLGSLTGKISPAGTACEPKSVRFVVSMLVLLATGWFAPGAFAATGTCGAATGQGTGPADYPTYCWIDFTNYSGATASGAGGQAFTITLPGGSTLSFTLTVSTVLNAGGTVAGGGLNAVTVPTWSGAAFGQTAFTGVPGKPALYQSTNATTTTVTLSNLVLTVGSGTVPYAIVAADAESTNSTESLSFTTNGNPWTLLASMPQGGVYPTLSGVNTTTVTETGVAGTVGAYAFATQGSPTTISSTLVGGGLQGIAFAVKFHAADFAITSTPSGSFAAGGTGTYTLGVTSNGPDTYSPSNTVTVTDTLPTGLSYVSASGSGWTCGDVGQVVTCTVSNITIASGGTLPNITLNVSVANTIASTVTNTATVASNPNLDFNSSNNTATNVTSILEPDLTNSAKAVVNTGGGDAMVGSTLQYTITLTESAGAIAVNASVADTVAATLTNVTVISYPAGATNSSSGNNISVTGITVPAGKSVTVVFTAQVAGGTANCTQINNTATITNPNGNTTTITPSAPTVTVAQSKCAASGNKILYLYDNTGPTYVALLNRIPQATATTTTVSVPGVSSFTWNMSPAVAASAPNGLILSAGNVTVTLVETATGTRTFSNRATTVTLLNNGTPVATSATVNVVGNTPTVYTYIITIPKTTVAAGNTLGITFNNNNGNTGRSVDISQLVAGTGNSTVSFATTTVINVDSVTAYNATYPAITTTSVFPPSQTGKTVTVYVCAVVSDPFGSYDVTSANITITDPNGTSMVSAATMTLNGGGGKDCSGTANSGVNSFEYVYTLPIGEPTGFWTASVTGFEGTEGTITHTANGSFDVDVPSLLVMKSVSVVSDPAEGTTNAKAIPGATLLYTILVQNNGRGPADSGSLVITDPVPANTVFYLTGATPFTFTNGGTASGLSAPVMTFSRAVGGGTPYTYSPTCTRPCTDTAITGFQITFTGSMNGKTGATAPSFTVTYEVMLQ